MDGFLEETAPQTATAPAAPCDCSGCGKMADDVKQMREQMTFLTHQIVQLMQVLCINNCRCSSCLTFIGASKIFSSKNNNHMNSVSAIGNGLLLQDHDDEELLKDAAHDPVYHHHYHHHHRHHSENGYSMTNGGGPIFRRYSSNRKRNIVGLDQLLPKLLAERVSDNGDSYPMVIGRDDEDDDEQSPKAGDSGGRPMITGASNGLCSRSSSADCAGSPPSRGPVAIGTDENSVNNMCDSFDEDDEHNKMDDGCSEEVARAWSKRQRFSIDDQDGNAGSRSTGSTSAVDRSCFLNESPCSSGGSLELPKTSADTIGANDLIAGNDDQNASTMALVNHHERSHHHYGYPTTNVTSLSTGLPLVMPGPKATTFFCTICNREFSNVYYKRHMIVHANSRPYVCDVCGKRFNERSNMMKHKQRLHGP